MERMDKINPQFLKRIREEASLTQRDLADKLGVVQPVVSRIEKGLAGIEIARLEDWLAACGYVVEVRRTSEPLISLDHLSDRQKTLILALIDLLPSLNQVQIDTLWLLVEGWEESTISNSGQNQITS